MTLADEILAFVRASPGHTDREITNALRGASEPQQNVNQSARLLESQGLVVRQQRHDGLIGNYPSGQEPVHDTTSRPAKKHDVEALSEDEIKQVLIDWLTAQQWQTKVAWGRALGIDLDARRGSDRWIIEVKGPGSRPPMRVNYFLGILGETLQRMDDPNARYSIALPDLPQFRRLWGRLPELAKSRTAIGAIFVSKAGDVDINES